MKRIFSCEGAAQPLHLSCVCPCVRFKTEFLTVYTTVHHCTSLYITVHPFKSLYIPLYTHIVMQGMFRLCAFLFSCEGAAQHVHLCLCLCVCLSVRLSVVKTEFLPVYTPLHPLMPLCAPLCPFMPLYVPLFPFIPLYATLCHFMPLYTPLCLFIPLYKLLHAFTRFIS